MIIPSVNSRPQVNALISLFRVSLLVVGVGALLTACETVEPIPEVVDAAEASGPEPVSPVNIEMIRALSELNALKEELKLLRNSVEELQFQQENANRRQQDSFQDIDRRLLVLERNEGVRQEQAARDAAAQLPLTPSQEILLEGQISQGALTLDPPLSTTPENTIDEGLGSSSTDSGTPINTVSVSNASTTESNPTQSTKSVTLSEQDAYDAAFELLKQSRYQDAIEAFQDMVGTWPASQLADDALYWMSEANYVNREFEAALNGFRIIVESYPDSTRLPEAMLKVGYIQYDIGAYDSAAETFQDILTRFPGHQVTVSAETRLRRIKQTIQ